MGNFFTSWELLSFSRRTPLHGVSKKVKVIPLQARCGPEGGRGIALLFHDRGTRRGWVVSSTPLPPSTIGKESVPILQQAGWAPGPVWTGGKTRPHRDSIPDRPARSQSLYRLSYPAHPRSVWTQIVTSNEETVVLKSVNFYVCSFLKCDVIFLVDKYGRFRGIWCYAFLGRMINTIDGCLCNHKNFRSVNWWQLPTPELYDRHWRCWRYGLGGLYVKCSKLAE